MLQFKNSNIKETHWPFERINQTVYLLPIKNRYRMVTLLSLFVSVAAILSISLQVSGLQILNLLRQPIIGRESFPGFSCLSWRLAVETNNIRDWTTVPKICQGYVGDYMQGTQYREDSRTVTDQASRYAESLELAGDGKDVWIFDIDDTSLSNLPFYALYGFGYVRNCKTISC